MNVQLHNPGTGWIGLSIAMKSDEIDVLIRRLTEVKAGSCDHFHFRTDDFSADEGTADVEWRLLDDDDEEPDNMSIE